MRACLLRRRGPIESAPLAFEEVVDPVPGPGEVLIRVTACGICRTDLHVVEGDLADRRSPIIPGHQIVGEVVALGDSGGGPAADNPFELALSVGQRVGVAWLHRTCGQCRFCRSGRENLCLDPDFTGWTVDGGFAELCLARRHFVYPLPDGFGDHEAAPLLCAGIIGFRALRLTSLPDWRGARLGIYGFGAAGHVALQLARGRGAEVYVCTRDQARHQALAAELGATWVGGAAEPPPAPLDAAIIFAPAGELVPVALRAVDRGGSVVLGGIHMSPLPALPYQLIYDERIVRSVANNTRADGRDFLFEAARLPVRTHTEPFPLREANRALAALKNDAIRGAGVLAVA
ncbi:MAG TPA: zinc-dependent alcohol dehydrogenase family protein [Polyangia bacterium]|jgi:propanol-preferring alcohol dehydrogenase|nr:zinc-dependent alcohol dehydrogenase family protein [Polyangia bacterium]